MNKSFLICVLLFIGVLLTSHSNINIYILITFSISSLIIFPLNRRDDFSCFCLIVFPLFYIVNTYFTFGISSNYLAYIQLFLGPFTFYRWGQITLTQYKDEQSRLTILLIFILCYLMHVFTITFYDVYSYGLISPTRIFLSIADGRVLAATLYGLMASVGIGCIAAAFCKIELKIVKYGYLFVVLSSMLLTVHLINRTALFILVLCVLIILIDKKNTKSILITLLFVSSFLFFVVSSSNLEITEAYINRESSETSNTLAAGGRTELWYNSILHLLESPFGWTNTRHAHNLWLDAAKVGGWLSLFMLIIPTIRFFNHSRVSFILRKDSFSTMLRTICISTFIAASVEPVIEGSPLFFCLMLFFWGMLSKTVKETHRFSQTITAPVK